MHPVSLDAALLRLRLPDLVLRPGMSVVARVASLGTGQQGALVLAGQLLRASLPPEVRQGDTLKLAVAEATAERVVLRLLEQIPAEPAAPAAPAPSAPAPAAAAATQLPPGFGIPPPPPPPAHAVDPDAEDPGGERGGGRGRAGVSLVYETPALGRLDVRLDRGPEGIVATVGVPQGSHALADARARELREALEARLGVPATVRIAPRREPFDAYA